MSNTLNTPVEALELEFPLRVVRYAIRRGSGGAGAHRGGDGVIREIQALEPMTYSLLTERRRHAPPGAAGGGRRARGATCSTARSCLRRPRDPSLAGKTCRFRHPVAEVRGPLRASKGSGPTSRTFCPMYGCTS